MASQATSLTKSRRYSIKVLLQLQNDLLARPAPSGIVQRLLEISDMDEIITVRASLADVTNTNRHTLRLGRHRIGGSSSEESETHSVVNLKRDQRVNWYLRQREISDLSAQPHSAPAGLATQQAENFQRFYRAVVSPTHVRVTAGGRIVPNTRSGATAPPEWNAQKYERALPLLSTERTSCHPTTSKPATQQPLSATYLSSCSQFPQGNTLSLAMMASQGSEDGGVSLNLKSDVKAVVTETSTQPITISPPSQFDHSKPFIYNGQLVYPLPPGVQPPVHPMPVSYGVLGNPNFTVSAQLAPMTLLHPAKFPFPIGHLTNPPALPTINQHTMGTTPGAMHLDTRLHQYAPNPSIQTVSELTKHQVQIYRSHLKFIDNQLANNKHQIDEIYMEHQRRDILSTIEKLESMFEIQLAQEREANEIPFLHGSLHGLHQVSSARHERSSGADYSIQEITPMFVKPTSVPVHITAAPETAPPNSKTDDVKANMIEDYVSLKSESHSETGVKSRLSAAAAKAPPFQPRAKSAISKRQTSSDLPASKFESIPSIAHTLFDPQFMSQSSTACGLQASTTAATNGTSSLSRAYAMDSPISVHSTAVPRYQTFHGIPAVLSSHSTVAPTHSQAVPYLVGVLPHGINPSQAASMDLVYQRDLTPDEIRARFLYWGKAPRSAYAGLPKFDGKDFYPPSPTKEPIRLPVAPLNNTRENVDSSSVSPLNFESLFLDSPKAFKTTTPARIRPSLHNVTGSPSRPFLNNGLLRSPSPRNSKQRYNTSPGISIDANVTKSEYVPVTPPNIGERLKKSVSDDFSHLFLERGEAGYKSPSPLRLFPSAIEDSMTPKAQQFRAKAKELDNRDALITDSRRASSGNIADGSEKESSQAALLSNTPTGSMRSLFDTTKGKSLQSVKEGSSAERVNLNSVDQQSQLLQNMLRNTTLAAMSAPAPALSGKVSSTTAQGYLPIYRGSAAASLSPTMTDYKANSNNEAPGLLAAKTLPENQPLNVDGRSRVSIKTSTESIGAQTYMRYLANKADNDQKIIESGWNANTNATGPVMGSDW